MTKGIILYINNFGKYNIDKIILSDFLSLILTSTEQNYAMSLCPTIHLINNDTDTSY